MKQKVLIQFEPRQVVNFQMDNLLAFFNPNRIASAGLRDCEGILTIRFNYPSGNLYPLLIPNLRRFLRVMGRRWGPGSAPFFCETNGEFLPLYFAAQLEHLQIVTYAANDRLVVRHHPPELKTLSRVSLAGIRHLGLRAGMTGDEIHRRQADVSTIFSEVFRNPTRWEH